MFPAGTRCELNLGGGPENASSKCAHKSVESGNKACARSLTQCKGANAKAKTPESIRPSCESADDQMDFSLRHVAIRGRPAMPSAGSSAPSRRAATLPQGGRAARRRSIRPRWTNTSRSDAGRCRDEPRDQRPHHDRSLGGAFLACFAGSLAGEISPKNLAHGIPEPGARHLCRFSVRWHQVGGAA